MIIDYDPTKEKPIPRNAGMSLDGVVFLPGRNSISDEEYQHLSGLNEFKERVDSGAIALPPTPEPKTDKGSRKPPRKPPSKPKTNEQPSILESEAD